MRPVTSHWLSLGAVCQWLIGQYPAMSKYFLKTPSTGSNKATCDGDRYKRIKRSLEDESSVAYLNFVSFLTSSLSDFVKIFQTSDVLVHILYDKLNELVQNVMLKFLKSAVVQGKQGAQLLDLKCSDGDAIVVMQSIAWKFVH